MARTRTRWTVWTIGFCRSVVLGLALPLVLVASISGAESLRANVADRLELTELSHRYAWGVDTLDRDVLATVFTKDASAHYVEVGSKLIGLDEELDGFEAIWTWLHSNLKNRKGPAGLPMHFMSNHLIEINSDSDRNKAKLTFYMHNRKMSAGGVYYVDAVRTKAGWRIHHLRLEEQVWKPEAYGVKADTSSD